MKKSYVLAFAAALTLFGSCTSDMPDAPQFEPIDEEGNIGYIRIDFPGVNTRAMEASAPTEDESEVENAAFVFYCGNNQYFTRYAKKTREKTDQAYWVEVAEGHVGKRCAIVKLPRLPQSVAVVVNGEKTYSGDLNEDRYTVDKYAQGNNKLFYMSSARYWDQNRQLTNQTPITPDMIFTTDSAAIKATDAAGNLNAVKVNVEHYVAKVNIKQNYSEGKYKLDAEGCIDPQANKEEVGYRVVTDSTQATDMKKAYVKFKPEFTFLTATSKGTTTIKKLPEFSKLATPVQNWSDLNDPVNRHSSWLRNEEQPREVHWPTLNELQAGTLHLGHSSVAYVEQSAPIYAFDNRDDDYGRRTSVVVAGKYSVTDENGKTLADPATGSFWLVAYQDKFNVYSNEADAIKAMGGITEGTNKSTLVPDVTLPDGQSALTGREDGAWTSWTGWMKLSDGRSDVRCIKYNGGYGYYAEPINHIPNYDMVVRNHQYQISINGIGGMGVGIPSGDTPIVPIVPPNPNDQNYWLHMSVNVLDWRNISNDVEWQ